MNNNKKDIILDIIKEPNYIPLKISELAYLLGVDKENKDEFNHIIEEMLTLGEITLTKTNKLVLSSKLGFVKGIFYTSKKGYGFVRLEGDENATSKDYFITETNALGAMDRDSILVQLLNGSDAKVIRVLKRNVTLLVGTVTAKPKPHIKPDNIKLPPVYIDKNEIHGVVTGDKVVIKITKYPSPKSKLLLGEIKEVLGNKNDPGVDILSIIKEFEIPTEFPQEVLDQIKSISSTISPEGRVDLRNEEIFTIDGDDAKDLDDGISLKKHGENYILGVHIADVAHYVTEDSPLDKEAINRGTSVYLADRVIPMLPAMLSNGLCSLTEAQDRLALSCIMEIDITGQVISHKIEETIINIKKRMSYQKVAALLDENKETPADYEGYKDTLHLMEHLSKLLRFKRVDRGALDFGIAEAKVKLDELGHPIDIVLQEKNIATKIIEEFMLIANETVAEHFYWLETPFIYRNHEKPDREKLELLNQFISNFGYRIKGNKSHPKSLQNLLSKLENTEEENIIASIVLRSLKQARYSELNEGHFGLSAKYYCHFTSPIRRYPDLAIHRVIKDFLHGKTTMKDFYDIALHASRAERRAVDAERKTLNYKKAEFMQDKIGQKFHGIISSVTSWGVYVELPNTVEGMIKKADLTGDYFVYDKLKHQYIGERTGKTYSLGDPIKVRLVKIYEHKLDFELSR